MPLIYSKIELKLRCTEHCVLTVTVNDNSNDNLDTINFIIKDKKLYNPVVTLSAEDN